MFFRKLTHIDLATLPVLMGCVVRAALAVDIQGVLPASTDQPQTHAILLDSNGNVVSVPDGMGGTAYDIQGFLDTGTSGVILSLETQEGLGLNLDSYGTQPITFQDVAIGGSDTFNVTTPYSISTAAFSIGTDQEFLQPPPPLSAYSAATGPVRMEVNPNMADELIGPIDIFGMPVMQNKVAVFDLRPPNATTLDNFGETATYLYNPGTPYQPATLDTDPGIVATQYHIKLSYGSFSQFTQTNPTGAPSPVLNSNPFIGPNPVSALGSNPPADDTPPVKISFNGHSSTGSFLFDTGAQASFISTVEALSLGVEYGGTDANGDPFLIDVGTGTKIPNQFVIPLTGAGGQTITAAGFYLDSLKLQTIEGEPINYVEAPVLVQDVTVRNPTTGQSLTLDGDLGMNFFEPSTDPLGLQNVKGPFDWMTFDQPNGLLGVTFSPDFNLPEPSSAAILLVSAPLILRRRRSRNIVMANPAGSIRSEHSR